MNKFFFGGKLDNLDFVVMVKNQFGLDGIEYVNQFFKDKVEDSVYLVEMKKRVDDNGVKFLLIMIDCEGNLGGIVDVECLKVVENYYKWVDVVKYLGCYFIWVNVVG